MKKLMIAAAIVCAAVVSQAASYEWTGGDIYECWKDASSENYAAGTAYFFIEGYNGVTYADLTKAVSDGKFDAAWIGKAADQIALNNEGGFGNTYDNGAEGTDYIGKNMYAVIVADGYYDGDNDGKLVKIDDKYAFVTQEVEAGAQPALGSAQIPFGSQEVSWDPSGWTAQSVPEPTSGLLLLLGVAGLALRRRRA